MDTLIISATRALRSLFARGMFGIFVACVLATIAGLTGFVIVASVFFSWLGSHLHESWLGVIGGFGSGIIAWFLFPGIMPIVASFFDERIAKAIESQDYPQTAPAREPNFWAEFFHDVRFSGVAILLNIVVLPLYFLPVLNLCLFYILNGYLLGREFFVMAAKRHMPVQGAETLRKQHGKSVMSAGILLTLAATVPIMNLFAPFWGVALMVHLYHRLTVSGDSGKTL